MAKFKQDRKNWFGAVKCVASLIYRRPEFVFLGDRVTENSIILSNHEGSHSPLTLEIYADFPIRFWGTHLMNSGLKTMYEYQSRIYYHQKHHWNLTAARLFCLIASPITNMFYKGLRLISTYPDYRFLTTLRESRKAVKEGSNIVVFPEDSSLGYHRRLKSFYPGFVVLADSMLKRGIDMNIYTAYFKREDKKFIFDKPVKFSELKAISSDKYELAKIMLERCNALGEMSDKDLEGREKQDN